VRRTRLPGVRASLHLCFSSELGTYADPNFVEAVLGGGTANVGQPVGLKQASGTDPAQDFMPGGATRGGKVSHFYADGMVSAEVSSHYGDLAAVQQKYTPFGVESGLCVGLARGRIPERRAHLATVRPSRHDGVGNLSRPASHDAGALPHRQRLHHRLQPPVRDAFAAQRSRERQAAADVGSPPAVPHRREDATGQAALGAVFGELNEQSPRSRGE